MISATTERSTIRDAVQLIAVILLGRRGTGPFLGLAVELAKGLAETRSAPR
jgi:hypothetical protein